MRRTLERGCQRAFSAVRATQRRSNRPRSWTRFCPVGRRSEPRPDPYAQPAGPRMRVHHRPAPALGSRGRRRGALTPQSGGRHDGRSAAGGKWITRDRVIQAILGLARSSRHQHNGWRRNTRNRSGDGGADGHVMGAEGCGREQRIGKPSCEHTTRRTSRSDFRRLEHGLADPFDVTLPSGGHVVLKVRLWARRGRPDAVGHALSDAPRLGDHVAAIARTLTFRGASPALHRDARCARPARRAEREYRLYLTEAQRRRTDERASNAAGVAPRTANAASRRYVRGGAAGSRRGHPESGHPRHEHCADSR